ncbi:DNA polymerase delta subunit 2 [Anaeramoeba ignava]|uniref:DNA polymerase delta subunit 2 n=1 Tax=Anaeramoeba ignava TaxID=1746090 RepID=A0A9Q0RDQ1_ANAIG|nr:DNA polymerase delta subunit 2 [Anaeramoeba ignava]
MNEIKRKNANYKPLHLHLIRKSTEKYGNKQFYLLYQARLKKLQPILTQQTKLKWGSNSNIKILKNIVELNEFSSKNPTTKAVITGVIYKESPNKPSVLRELRTNKQRIIDDRISEIESNIYHSKSEQFFLEDQQGRIEIVDKTGCMTYLVTGMVVACLGNIGDGEIFYVTEICLPGLNRQKLLENSIQPNSRKLVALVSDLRICDPETDLTAIDLLVDYLSGFVGDSKEQKLQSEIVRLVIAGNSLSKCSSQSIEKTSFNQRFRETSLISVKTDSLDSFLLKVSSIMHVDLMPGLLDPSNLALPQQPFHFCLLKNSLKNKSMQTVTNPYLFQIDETIFAGESGQIIDDIAKYLDPSKAVKNIENQNENQNDLNDLNDLKFIDLKFELFKRYLECSHFSPTSPDTLPCFPFSGNDPFILDVCPHVYFSGCQKKLKYEIVEYSNQINGDQKVLLIFIPSFFITQTILLVDINTLECFPVEFSSRIDK